jgi:dsDNA-binding SOS-regulon protein
MTIRTALEDTLAAHGVSAEQFSELMIRLLDHGVLCRDENKREAEFYDRYLQVADLVEDYLTVLRIRLLHEPRFHSLRLFPPGAEVPGLADTDDAFNSGLRERLSQAEVALILVLRAEYDKSLREGQIDENGQVTLPLEALSLAHKNLLGRPLPEGLVDRRNLFRRLRQLRIIRYAGDEALEDSESWLTIRPDITSLVSDTVLAELADAGEPASNDAPSPEEDAP